MDDIREKVIKESEEAIDILAKAEEPIFWLDFVRCAFENALALLKGQETGHWISLENCSNSGVYCSECHTKVFDECPIKKKFSYFCPHCGTRMEGEIERR